MKISKLINYLFDGHVLKWPRYYGNLNITSWGVGSIGCWKTLSELVFAEEQTQAQASLPTTHYQDY
jgi:hypothetical protein